MKSRKLLVFILNEVAIIGVIVGLFLFANTTLTSLLPWAVGALVANGAAYATGNVLTKQIISKNYHEELTHEG